MAVTSAELKQLIADNSGVEYGGGDIRDTPNVGWVRVDGGEAAVASLVDETDGWLYTKKPPLSAVEHEERDERFYLIPEDS